ncbi:MAG TPA: peptidoglycan-binding domain-containing protein [Gemmatales bacterium]|nr:peptidoglycan-binding domain-containing protein [Gemmatales bacterium]HMP59191.1 peptidoglycan-binding domain-containing protein [Gemmatales bacterium]
MALVSPRFAHHVRLQSAARNQPPLRPGESGAAVGIVQQALIDLGFLMPITTRNQSAPPDGIYGEETTRIIRAFQKQHSLSSDGIAGQDTMHALDAAFLGKPGPAPAVEEEVHACGNCYSLDHAVTRAQAHLTQSKFNLDLGQRGGLLRFSRQDAGAKAKGLFDTVVNVASEMVFSGTGISIPTSVTPLATWLANAAKETRQRVTDAFGTSLDPSNIMITNGKGVDGRAFVAFVPRKFQAGLKTTRKDEGVLFVNWGDQPDADLVVHELTHCWQSQHATAQGQFMINALKSQQLASKNKGSAYAWQHDPRRLFKEYAAEQIAQQACSGIGIILTHLKSVAAWAVDADNDTCLATPRWEDPNRAGVRRR